MIERFIQALFKENVSVASNLHYNYAPMKGLEMQKIADAFLEEYHYLKTARSLMPS